MLAADGREGRSWKQAFYMPMPADKCGPATHIHSSMWFSCSTQSLDRPFFGLPCCLCACCRVCTCAGTAVSSQQTGSADSLAYTAALHAGW